MTLNEWLQDVIAEEAGAQTEPPASGDGPLADPGALGARFIRATRGEEEELGRTSILLQAALLLHNIDPIRAERTVAQWFRGNANHDDQD
jgi:hypothetical protein